jgi:hypothetical protein
MKNGQIMVMLRWAIWMGEMRWRVSDWLMETAGEISWFVWLEPVLRGTKPFFYLSKVLGAHRQSSVSRSPSWSVLTLAVALHAYLTLFVQCVVSRIQLVQNVLDGSTIG